MSLNTRAEENREPVCVWSPSFKHIFYTFKVSHNSLLSQSSSQDQYKYHFNGMSLGRGQSGIEILIHLSWSWQSSINDTLKQQAVFSDTKTETNIFLLMLLLASAAAKWRRSGDALALTASLKSSKNQRALTPKTSNMRSEAKWQAGICVCDEAKIQ